MQILCYMLLASLPGIPCVFYGDETGMEGYHDPLCRRPFNWRNTTDNPRDAYADQILAAYREIGKIRSESEVLVNGEFRIAYCDKNAAIIVRQYEKEVVATVINRSDRKMSLYADCTFIDMATSEKVMSPKINAKSGKYVCNMA